MSCGCLTICLHRLNLVWKCVAFSDCLCGNVDDDDVIRKGSVL